MKNQSDIFICKLKQDDYWAYPSPFVAHGCGFEIQFRNLTKDTIEIDLGDRAGAQEDAVARPGRRGLRDRERRRRGGVARVRGSRCNPRKRVAATARLRPRRGHSRRVR